MQNESFLNLQGISKSFGGVQALRNIDLKIKHSEVHAILGENGAGKSTLMKIIAGALHPDTGKIRIDENTVEFKGTRDAVEQGISIVYQEPTFFSELSVLENFFVGEMETKAFGVVDWNRMALKASKALKQMGLPVSLLGKKMSDLSIGTQQLVLIAKGIHKKARLLILDEPTSILSKAETDLLFEKIKELKSKGVSILYISHRMQEIFQIADRITVLRDGDLVAQFDIAEANEDVLITKMSGREIQKNIYRTRNYKDNTPILEVKKLTRVGEFQDISFNLRPGEILGLYGLVGAGRTELALSIFGEAEPDQGHIYLENKIAKPKGSADAISKGVVYIPEDRQTQGLFSLHSIKNNLSAGLLFLVSNILGVVNEKKENQLVSEQIKQLRIKIGDTENLVTSLSGGNQQKVVLGRGIRHNPKVLILDEPTRGIDVGTKAEVHQLVMDIAEKGVAVIFISSELKEVLEVADNFMVMHEGNLAGFLPRDQAEEYLLLQLALGVDSKTELVESIS